MITSIYIDFKLRPSVFFICLFFLQSTFNQEKEQAPKKMWDYITLSNMIQYFKTKSYSKSILSMYNTNELPLYCLSNLFTQQNNSRDWADLQSYCRKPNWLLHQWANSAKFFCELRESLYLKLTSVFLIREGVILYSNTHMRMTHKPQASKLNMFMTHRAACSPMTGIMWNESSSCITQISQPEISNK